MNVALRVLATTLLVLATTALAACGDEAPFTDSLYAVSRDGSIDEERPWKGDGAVDTDASAADAGEHEPDCRPADSSDHIPARRTLITRHALGGGPAGVFTSDLFGLFQSHCGGCHVDNALGGLQVSLLNFPTAITEEALNRLTSEDASYFMPPDGAGGRPFSSRAEGDPVLELAKLLEAWIAAGRPADVFYPESDSTEASGESPYKLNEVTGTQLTNLGTCIPSARIVGTETDAMDALDAMFERADALPERLEQTDFNTLDGEELARHGVLGFAPGYTLWADNAKKLRLIRVPRGTSIRFDPERQAWDIPDNTRIYKTFLKRVIDRDGHESYRKIETRVILVRHDEQQPDGTFRVRALYGTYAWDEQETEALLLRDPLRNGKPFRDRVFQYVIDEHAAEDIIATGPDDLQAALQQAGLTRTYGIPGATRCEACYMGATDGSFQLGFIPLQIRRRPMGEGGVIEPSGPDELSQLQRFIDYGLITGLSSPDAVKLLEDSQGERKPRNEHELIAQGYMLGNCAHCHNTRGFPSVIAPELRDLLHFFPNEQGGGIFQFPLERFSPRIARGEDRGKPIPYITPSLYDAPGTSNVNYIPKVLTLVEELDAPPLPIAAPWRSLIYRNVDAPFSYEEDYAIYPRMPMHTSGYDCRVRRIMGEWMTSIPARMKEYEANEDLSVVEREIFHPDPQPFEEALPGDADYTAAKRAAQRRLRRFQESERYSDCPAPELDVVDPRVVRGEILTPVPLHREVLDAEGNLLGAYDVRAPERPHFAVTDLTDAPGDWNPRRPDWKRVLVELDIGDLEPGMQARVRQLQDVRITAALREFALTVRPFGRWQEKDGCDFSAQSHAADVSPRPRWMDVTGTPSDAPIYSIEPGAQVFTFICANCHGPLGDAQGRLAATIADMTGGQTRVANLRDGFFGPVDMAAHNRERVFGEVAASIAQSTDDLAARYLLWMGLGGTQRTIPRPALDAIQSSSVLGEKRPNPSLGITDANMLSVAQGLCSYVLPTRRMFFDLTRGQLDESVTSANKTALIERNGDADLWHALCAIDNARKPIRVISVTDPRDDVEDFSLEARIDEPLYGGLRDADSYPAGTPIGDGSGHVQASLTADNVDPFCIKRPNNPKSVQKVLELWQQGRPDAGDPPYCPDALLLNPDRTPRTDNLFDPADAERWMLRGAMNAGLSVFVYPDALARGEQQRVVQYNRCEELAR